MAGALSFDDAFRLVQEIALLQEEPLPDGGAGGKFFGISSCDSLSSHDLNSGTTGVVAAATPLPPANGLSASAAAAGVAYRASGAFASILSSIG